MKKKILSIFLAAALTLSVTGCADGTAENTENLIKNEESDNMLSATYSMNYNENIYCIPYQITFNSDGNCVIIKEEFEYLSATYTYFDNGQYVIEIPMLFTSWVAEFEGDILKVQGTGITSGGKWAEMHVVDEVQKKNETYQTSVITEIPTELTEKSTKQITTRKNVNETTTTSNTTTTAITTTITETQNEVDYSNFIIENGVLVKCINPIGKIVIPDNVTVIGNSAFHGAKELTEVIIPDSVTEIGAAAFMSCGNLTTVRMSQNLEHIGGNAFSFCVNIINITLPESLTFIGDNAFDCYKSELLIIPDNLSYLGRSNFANVDVLIHKDISYSDNSRWLYRVINEGISYTPPYFDDNGTLIWQEEKNCETYYVYVKDNKGNYYHNATDTCFDNNSRNYIYYMTEAELSSGWYILEIFGNINGLLFFIGNIDYYFEG